MKTLGFFLVLVGLVGGGFYLMASKFEVFDGMNIRNGEILPSEDWSEILVGKWKYRRILRASFYSWVYEGEVEFTADRKFKRYVTCKYYEGHKGEIDDDYLRIVTGGSYLGRWSVDTIGKFFREDIENCDMSVGRLDSGYEDKSISFCESQFAPKNWWVYGDYRFTQSKFEVKQFDLEKIIIKGELFDEGASVQIFFTKEE